MAHDFAMPMSVREIQACIPHRYPFLFVDRVLELEKDKYIKAIKLVSFSDLILQGHFPGNPVFPGVLMVEGAAQAAGVFGVVCAPADCSSFLLAEVTETRFRRPVVPGDTMVYDVHLQKRRGPFYWFKATVTVEGTVAAEISFSARMQ